MANSHKPKQKLYLDETARRVWKNAPVYIDPLRDEDGEPLFDEDGEELMPEDGS